MIPFMDEWRKMKAKLYVLVPMLVTILFLFADAMDAERVREILAER